MPRFYFHVHDGRSELDTEGAELTSRDAARLMAVQLAGAILREEAYRQRPGNAWCLEVSDEASEIICRIEVSVSGPSADR